MLLCSSQVIQPHFNNLQLERTGDLREFGDRLLKLLGSVILDTLMWIDAGEPCRMWHSNSARIVDHMASVHFRYQSMFLHAPRCFGPCLCRNSSGSQSAVEQLGARPPIWSSASLPPEEQLHGSSLPRRAKLHQEVQQGGRAGRSGSTVKLIVLEPCGLLLGFTVKVYRS